MDQRDADGIELALRDGRKVRVRPAGPGDEAEFLQAFERLGRDARYLRFMRTVQGANVDRLRAVLASLPEQGIGLVAQVPAADGYDIVGSAIAFFAPDRASCEFATTVAAGYGGAGLGTGLLAALIAQARHRGIARMEGFVLARNKPMLGLARRLGFQVAPDPDDPALRICRLALAPQPA